MWLGRFTISEEQVKMVKDLLMLETYSEFVMVEDLVDVLFFFCVCDVISQFVRKFMFLR